MVSVGKNDISKDKSVDMHLRLLTDNVCICSSAFYRIKIMPIHSFNKTAIDLGCFTKCL